MTTTTTDWCIAWIPAVLARDETEVKAGHWADYPVEWAIEQGYGYHSRRPATGTLGGDRLTPGLRT